MWLIPFPIVFPSVRERLTQAEAPKFPQALLGMVPFHIALDQTVFLPSLETPNSMGSLPTGAGVWENQI